MAGTEREPTPIPVSAAPGRSGPAPAEPERGGVTRRDLRTAGGYEAQRRMLQPDPDPRGPRGQAGDHRGPSAAAPAPATGSPQKVPLRSLEARVMTEPQFLGASVATLRRGAEVQILGRSGSWMRVRIREGQEGWLHENHVRDVRPTLAPGGTGSQNMRRDDPTDSDNAGRG